MVHPRIKTVEQLKQLVGRYFKYNFGPNTRGCYKITKVDKDEVLFEVLRFNTVPASEGIIGLPTEDFIDDCNDSTLQLQDEDYKFPKHSIPIR
jgi:hypothetical protein